MTDDREPGDERALLALQLATRAGWYADLTAFGLPRPPEAARRQPADGAPRGTRTAKPDAGGAGAGHADTAPGDAGTAAARGATPDSADTHQGLPPAEALASIRRVIGDCQRCALARGRTNIVFGQGNPEARLMFVGEAPGADEDLQALAFVGKAGQLLTKIIEAIELTRDDVYIANVIKCRPPGNRNPEPEEILSCQPFLESQIAAIRPTVIVALGKFAAQWLLRTAVPISQLRGRVGERDGIQVMPTWHPAYLLRNPGAKREVWEDMKAVRALLAAPRGGNGPRVPGPPGSS